MSEKSFVTILGRLPSESEPTLRIINKRFIREIKIGKFKQVEHTVVALNNGDEFIVLGTEFFNTFKNISTGMA